MCRKWTLSWTAGGHCWSLLIRRRMTCSLFTGGSIWEGERQNNNSKGTWRLGPSGRGLGSMCNVLICDVSATNTQVFLPLTLAFNILLGVLLSLLKTCLSLKTECSCLPSHEHSWAIPVQLNGLLIGQFIGCSVSWLLGRQSIAHPSWEGHRPTVPRIKQSTPYGWMNSFSWCLLNLCYHVSGTVLVLQVTSKRGK